MSEIFIHLQRKKVNQMNKLLNAANNSLRAFVKDEDGAQVVEYGLIIAVVSIALVIALSNIAEDPGPFEAFITRVETCLTGAVGTCV